VHLQGVSFVNFIGSLRWINVMKSAFQVVGYVGYVLTSVLRYVATGVPSNTLMRTALSDIADLDVWTLPHYRRPKQYQ
jgi:hypothetical protein